MAPLLQGAVAGVLFGAATVAGMLPMKFENRRRALTAAFVNRFSIGLVIPLLQIALPGSPGWAVGLGTGVLFSLSVAIVTEAYVPIMLVGAIGGTIIGLIV